MGLKITIRKRNDNDSIFCIKSRNTFILPLYDIIFSLDTSLGNFEYENRPLNDQKKMIKSVLWIKQDLTLSIRQQIIKKRKMSSRSNKSVLWMTIVFYRYL